MIAIELLDYLFPMLLFFFPSLLCFRSLIRAHLAITLILYLLPLFVDDMRLRQTQHLFLRMKSTSVHYRHLPFRGGRLRHVLANKRSHFCKCFDVPLLR